ncbi:phosphotransferase [Arcanobacterium sp. S3PF19]|uniref:phosphotransferase n=1 Tax=Arcanobacterium sp. S3PF19 TaxID=1219585 RepID=UPI00050F5BD3|nr:phosphotransferase [Arcanobacterium sp. S3PF19]KGF05911.1 MarR family transcriptional regulator [Arcanobacterium sp. S3PF19]
MNLSHPLFSVLRELAQSNKPATQRQLCEATGLSLGSVNAALGEAKKRGYIGGNRITEAAMEALKPYEVQNAVIMAAGLSSRFAPISYELPKGLLRVRGEVLIERQIRQLHAAGITDITVVVGYKKEYFFYLAARYGVKIAVNCEYAVRNNNSTLYLVREKLGNTYICSSDNYFTENPFEHYVYGAFYAVQHVEGETGEWCVTCGPRRRITKVEIGGRDCEIMLGHVYFDRAFSKKFTEILENVYHRPETAPKLWEQIYVEHIKELNMTARLYGSDVIKEFDSPDELRNFDPDFMKNVDSEIFDNICAVLRCKKEEIGGFFPLKQGLTNLSCHFTVNGKEYVYRHPGAGTDRMIDRKSENTALRTARDLGLDSTFIYEDEEKGWKISRFIPNARSLDANNAGHLRRAMQMCRKLHESGAVLPREFDFYRESLRYEKILGERKKIDIPGYAELKKQVAELKAFADADGFPLRISHNDFFTHNFLLDVHDTLNLIDWEYAGMSDIAGDFGTFCVCCSLDETRANACIDYYFGRAAEEKERRHFWAYVVFAGWCWYVWSLVKESEGEKVDEWLYTYFSYAERYAPKILRWYKTGVAPVWQDADTPTAKQA